MLHKWFTGYHSFDHLPDREVFIVEIIQHIFDDLPIRETHIASQAITQQPFEDRSSYGAPSFIAAFSPCTSSKVSPLGSLPLASTGYSFLFVLGFFRFENLSFGHKFFVRHADGIKVFQPSPMKSKRAWQDAHCDFCWCNCTSVRTLGRGFSEDAISSGTLGGGGVADH